MNKPQYEYTSLKGLGSVLSVLLLLNFLVIFVSIGSDLMEINMLNRIVAGETVARSEIEANDSRRLGMVPFFIAFEFVQGIVFLKWFYRASANAHVYSSADMTYSAGWSVGWFFVPIMNLFRPYQAMKETWQVSLAGPDDDPSFDVSVPSVVSLWWGLWIVTRFSTQLSFRLRTVVGTWEGLLNSDYVSIGDSVLTIALTAVALKMVRDLTNIQTERGALTYGPSETQGCPECGEQIQTDSTSCPMCGATLSSATTLRPSDPNRPSDSNPFAT